MPTTAISENTPEARCYECGSPDITTLCHHCGRPMCAAHSPRVTDFAGRARSLEFTNLGLSQECGEHPFHCPSCMHEIPPPKYDLVIGGAIVVFVGLLVVAASVEAGIVFLLAGAALAGYGLYLVKKRAGEALSARPPLPLLPRLLRGEIQERLRYRIAPTATGYDSCWDPVEGLLRVTATLGKPDREQLDRYRAKYKLDEADDVWFRAGFFVPRGVGRIKFDEVDPTGLQRGTVIPLSGKTSSYPDVFSPGAKGERRIELASKYTWRRAPEREFLPIRVIPSFVQDAGRKSLELEVQWSCLSAERGLRVNRIELLDLRVPTAWGKIEATTDNAVIGESAAWESCRTVTWRRLPIAERMTEMGRRSFHIRFGNQMGLPVVSEDRDSSKTDGSDRIVGHVEMSFTGALSGVQGAMMFYPVGKARDRGPADMRTYVSVSFEFNLADLRYQGVRVLPDKDNGLEAETNDEEATLISEGVIPDHSTVTALTDAMNRQGFYVKRVVENPPRTWGHANEVNRCWDVAGRKYNGIHPVDFHLVLAGEELYSGDMRAQGGTTKITLSVQGPYVNREMEEQIENAWEQLCSLIESTMRGLPRRKPGSAPHGVSEQVAAV